MIRVNLQGERDYLDSLIADRLSTYKVHLYQNDFTPDEDFSASDFVESDFPDYADRSVPSWSPALTIFIGGIGFAATTHPGLFWTVGSAPFTPQYVFGYYAATALGVVKYAERLPSPVFLDSAGQTFELDPIFLLNTILF